MLLFASCQNKEVEFDNNAKEFFIPFVATLKYSVDACDAINKTWHDAIWKREMPDGSYCSDWQEAVVLTQNDLKNEGIIDSVEVNKDRMLLSFSKLNNPPASRKECYEDLHDMVSLLNKLSRMAISPSGSLASYQENYEQYVNDVVEKSDEFRMKYSYFFNNEEE